MLAKLTLRRLLLAGSFLFFTNFLIAQNSVTGKVTDANGLPVVGATVSVRGSTVATQTDADGSFTIIAPKANSRLAISSVGFAPQDIAIEGKNNIAVSLKTSASNLNEVVVTGYTSQRKKDITGAVSVVNVTDLKTQPTSDVASQLQGRASGVTIIQSGVPGSGATVRIRGLGSFTNNNPLYVVDGVQIGNISGLNPNDIESLQVLKDAASASIYGVRASNGVIIITTKKGRKKGVSVSYDMFYGSQDPGKGLDLLNAQEEANLLFLARRNSGLPLTGSIYGNGATPVLPDFLYYTGAANNGTPIMAGNPGVDPTKYDLNYNLLGTPLPSGSNYSPYIIVPFSKGGTNWYNEATRNAPIQSHNLTLSGANDGSRFLLSLNYYNQDAITKYQFFNRYTARMNSEFNVTKTIRVGENLQVYTTETNVPNETAGQPFSNNSEASVIAQTSRITSVVPVYTIVPGDFAGTLGGSGFGTFGNGKNALATLYRTRNDRNNNINVLGNVYAEVDIAKHFTARSSFGGSINYNNVYMYPYIEYEHTENAPKTNYNENFIKSNNWIWTNQLTYKNIFGKHAINVLAGTEAQKIGAGRQVIGSATTFYTYNYLPYINLTNGSVQNLSGSNIFNPVTTVSYFAKLDYAFNGKYLVSGTIRRDGSSKFLGSNQYGTFPAFSLGWRISDESFMKSLSWISDLKLRGSWGKLGNEAAVPSTNAFTTFGSSRNSSFYDINGSQSSSAEGFYLSFLGNTDGRWEENITSNIGFDATLFKGSTEIVFDYYNKTTDKLLYNPPQQAILGAAAPLASRNVAKMKNTGVDVLVSNRSNITRDLRLNTSLTFTTYNNVIEKISNLGTPFFDYNSPTNEANRIGSNATRNFVGESFNTYFGYQVVGLWQKQSDIDGLDAAVRAKTPGDTTSVFQSNSAPGRFRFQDVNGDGKITPADRTIIGNPNPKFTYGFNLGLEYKNFDLSAFFYGVAGKDAFSFTRWYTDFSGGFPGGRSKRSLYESWLPDGSRPNAKTPIEEASFNSGNTVSSYFVEDASYFRLRNLQIGYTFPTSLTNKIKISRARIYIQGANLFTITKYDGLNPEITSTDDRAASIDIGAYPTVRQYLVGANITF